MNSTIWGRWVGGLFQKRRRARRGKPVHPALNFEALEDRVTPTTFIWTGLGTNNNWSTGANWQGGVAPSTLANPDIVFNNATPRLNTTNDIASLAVKSITLSASNYILGGNAIQLGGNVIVGPGATNEKINLDLQLTTAVSITVNNVSDLTISGHINGSPTLTKKGIGMLTLTSDNSLFTGAVDVQSGRLVMTNVGALGSTAGNTTVEANAQLQIKNVASPITEPLILNGPGASNDGALLNMAGSSIWSGTITMDSDASFGAAADTTLTVSGLITDTGFTGGHNLTKVGAGTVVFNRVGGNTYRGQTIINNGVLTIRDPLSLGAGATAGTPQSGTPQSGTIVNYNSTTGEAGTLQIELTSAVTAADPNAILANPALPFDPVNNPVIGFQVFNDLLTLNGPGFNDLGALNNLTGKNIWNGDVTLGSPLPNTSDITIAVNSGSQLAISGIVSDDPGRTGPDIPDLIKTLTGRLILDNANTYRGNTLVEEGILTIRDSHALGAFGAGAGSTTVSDGAALELQVDSGLDGTPQRTHNRNLGFDSVRKSGLWQEIVVPGTSGTFNVTFNGSSTGPLDFNASAADVQAALEALPGIGVGNVVVTQDATVYRVTFTGALAGVNVPLLTVSGTAGAVVNNAYGLTVPEAVFLIGQGLNGTGAMRSVSGLNVFTGTATLGTLLQPVGSIGVDTDSRAGHPTADNSYFTSDYSLTFTTPDALRSDPSVKFQKFGEGQLILAAANQQLKGPTEIWDGWITVQSSQSLGPAVADQTKGETVQPNVVTVRDGASLQLLPLSGNLTLPNRLRLFGQGITHPFAMLQEGAVLSLRGNNTLTGDIALGSRDTGIGVDDPIPGNPASASTLTATGSMFDYVAQAFNLSFTASGDQAEVRFPIDTGATSGRIIIDYDFLAVPDELRIYYPPKAQGGTLIFDSGVISGAGTFNVTYGPGTSTFVELVMNEGGGDPSTFWFLNNVQIIPDAIPGGDGLVKMGSRLLSLQGDGTYTGDVVVQSGTLRSQHDSALGRKGSGTAADPTTQTYTPTQTTVNAGGALQLDSTIPQNAGGFAAGVQTWDEKLVLNGAAQQVAISGTAGTFTLSFNGQDTSSLAFNATAADVQAALNALSTVGGAGGTATVTKAGNIFTVVFGGALAGLNNPLLIATAGPAPGNVTAIVSGTNYPLSALSQDNLWRGPITLAADTTVDVADNARLTLYGPIDDAANASPAGSSLTVGQVGTGDTGELVLSGSNTYRGTTYVKQGILTITNNQALGDISGGTVVDMGAQMQIQGSVTVAGESLTLSGSGVSPGDAPTSIPIRWNTIGSSPINNAQTPGNNASTGRVTGVAVDPSDPNVIYLSSAGGGAWKTKDGGKTWQPLFDNSAAMFSGAVAVAPSNPRVIYLGTGEADNSGDSYYGTGVYKSTDSGRTWNPVLNSSGTNPLYGTAVSRIVVDPFNADTFYAATSDQAVNNAAKPNSVGVWRHDGLNWLNLTSLVSAIRAGVTGQAPFNNAPVNTPGPDDDYRITFPQNNATWSDLAMVSEPGDTTRVLYAALGTAGGDHNNGVYRLINPQLVTGSNVQWLVGDPGIPFKADNRSGNEFPTGPWTNGLPSGLPRNGNIKISAAINDPLLPVVFPGPNTLNITIYAAITDPFSGALLEVQKSSDGGVNWAKTAATPTNYLGDQGWYDSSVAVDPNDRNTVYLSGLDGLMRSIDGGATWTDISVDPDGNGPHVDFHASQVDGQGRLIVGNDGGIWTWDPQNGKWTNINGGGLAITTFNGITTSPINPDFVLGGSQDNGTEKFTGSQAWEHVDDGDGGLVRFDLNDPNIAYHVLNGVLQKSTDGGNTWTTVLGVVDFGLYFPFAVDSISSRVVVGSAFPYSVGGINYPGSTALQESLDGGATWTDLSSSIPTYPFTSVDALAIATYQGNLPDGTYQFDQKFPLVGDKGANTYDPDTMYIIDSSNFFKQLWVTKDHAQSWVDRTPTLPGIGQMVDVMVDPRNRDTVYVVTQGVPGSGDNRILKSTNAGQSWIDITNNLADIPGPETDIPLWKVVVDPRDGTLYLGSDQGVWQLRAGTNTWTRFGAGMPQVQVKELDLNMSLNILTAGTYGRSAFQMHLDDVLPNSGALRATSGLSAWTGPVQLAGDTTIYVGGSQSLQSGASAATLDIIGVISDQTPGANFHLTKDGLGNLVFSGKNNYGGLTEVANGVLVVNNPDALGAFRTGPDITAQGGTVVDAGAALQMQTDLEGEPIVLNGDGVAPGLNGHNTGALRNISGSNTYTGPLTLATNATIGVDSGSELTIGTKAPLVGTGTITGSPNFTKELTGTLALASNEPGFTGATTVNQGAVRLENSGALGSGVSGARVLDGAQIQLRTPTSGPNAGQPVVVNAPLSLSGTGIFGSGALLNAGGNNTWGGPISFDVFSGFSPSTFPFGTVSINVPNAGDTLTLSGPIAEFAPTGLTKIGAGQLALQAPASYSGATEVVQGTLSVRDPSALGSRAGTASIQRIVTLSATQQGQFVLTFQNQSTAPPPFAIPFGASEATVKAALESLSTIGAGNIASVTRTEIPTTTQNGPGGPQTGYAYTVVFGGALANTQSQITATGALGTGASASVVATGGVDVRVWNGSTLALDTTGTPSSGFTVAGHQLSLNGTGVGGHGALDNVAGTNGWSGPVVLAANAAVGASAGSALSLTGGVTGVGLDLTKVDPGTLVFPTGGNNQGRTVINGGTVEVDGSLGPVRLAGGMLGGTGTVGAVTSNPGVPGTGGGVSPGVTYPASQIGTLTASSVVFDSSNTLFVNLSSPGGIPTSDVLNVTGSINLGNAALAGLVDSSVALGDQFTILTAGSITGQFAGIATTPVAGGVSATIAYIDNQKFVVDYFADHVVLTRQLANVTMNLAKTIASPVYGQAEKFTATLTPESPNLAVSGNVIFTVTDPANNVFTFTIPINPATNTATFDPAAAAPNGFGTPLQLGTYSVSASYDGFNSGGSVAFNPAAAGPVQATVTKAGTTTTLISSQAPSMKGVTVTFTATVTSAVGSPVVGTLPPEGTVTFRDTTTNTILGTASLTPGAGVSSTAAFSTSSLAVGSHVITATYNADGVPDDNYLGSASSGFTQIVTKSTTTVTMSSTPSPSSYGQPVTLTATVAGAGVGTPTGSVTFKLGATVLGTGVINGSGVASYTTTAFQLPGGTPTITAVYAGDGNFLGGTGTLVQTVNAIASTTTVASSANPSGFGAPVTFTATVTPSLTGGAVPTGTVTFILDGTTTLGTAALNASGIASFTTTPAQLSQGAHTITAQYAGDANYQASSGTTPQNVVAATTTTTLNAAPSKGTKLRAIAFTAHVASLTAGSGIPTGDVVFTDQTTGAVLGTAALDANGDAVLVHNLGKPIGTHTVSADYQGTNDYSVSSGSTSVSVIANGTRASSVALKSSANPSIDGAFVTFTATVRDTGGSPLVNPGGSVLFKDKTTGQILGYGKLAPISTGVMRTTFTINTLAVGSHDIVAKYSGNALFAVSISNVLTQVVKTTPARTSNTTLTPASVSSNYGQNVILTATVSDTGGGDLTPTGTVTFTDTTTNTVVATVPLLQSSLGVATATLVTNVLAVGTHDIVASYNGDTDFKPGDPSSTTTVTVAQSSTTLALSSNANPAKFGQTVTFKAKLISGSGGGVPTGTVSFFDAGVLIGTAPINASGVAALATSALSVGTHPITATYAGDGNFTGSDNLAAPLSQQVNKSATTATLARSTNAARDPLTLTATILALPPGGGVPTGSVKFIIDGIDRGTVTLVNGKAQLFLPNGVSQGTHTIVVKYLGDANYLTSTTSFSYDFGGRGG